MEECSVSGTISSRVSISDGGKPPVLTSRFFRWSWKSTPSLDWNVISESVAQTARELSTSSYDSDTVTALLTKFRYLRSRIYWRIMVVHGQLSSGVVVFWRCNERSTAVELTLGTSL